MKIAVLAVGAFVALAVSGPTAFRENSARQPFQTGEITVPAWLQLPSKPFISSIEYAGEAGAEAAFGTILYDLPTDGASEINWIREHLKAQGYSIDDRTASVDNFAGADVVISARDFVSGRRVNVVSIGRMDGANLRITFEDPSADSFISAL